MELKSEIEYLLTSVDADFDPPLSTRISIPEYAEKIHKNATIFSTHQGGELIAFIALYCNTPNKLTAYMTMLAVSRNHRNNGLASNLLETSIRFLKKLGFRILRLEVYKSNSNAINLYENFGFKKVDEDERDTSVFMELGLE
ncbi:MAG TPA: GNAT family N-acetyltransferase [Candidatus Nanopelagicaceae bacterium]